MVLAIVRSVGLILASAATGIFVCLVLWHAFKLLRHPEWGPPLILFPITLALAGQLPDSEFLRRSLVFAAVFACPFWLAGLAWRHGLRDRGCAARRSDVLAEPVPSNAIEALLSSDHYPRYPAIAGCICDDRRANAGELKRVALRMWREGLVAAYPTPGFRERRVVLRAARVALEGEPTGKGPPAAIQTQRGRRGGCPRVA